MSATARRSMTVRETAAELFQQMRDAGMTQAEIADATGYGRSTVGMYLKDPTGAGERARKDSYGGKCEDCGARTDGSCGRANAPKLCAACFTRHRHEDRRWTPEAIIAEMHRFVAKYGRKPTSSEWLKPKLADPDEPHVHVIMVQREFGSWNAGLAAAGLPTENPGRYERSVETRRRMSQAQREAKAVLYGHSRDYGATRQTYFRLPIDQAAALADLGGSRSEHIRRALDQYLGLPK